MSHDTKISPDAASDMAALTAQLAALRADMAHLAETVSGIAGRRGGHMAADIAEGFDEARQYVTRTSRSAEYQLEHSIADHPLLAIGLAAGAGLVVGAMSRR